MKKFRTLSHTEKGMLISIALLLVLLVLRWDYVCQRAADGWNYIRPIDSTALAPEAEGCE
jgi:hypothetical protein